MDEDATVLWYVRVDDEVRDPGGRLITRGRWEEIRRATAGIFKVLPSGASLHSSEAAGVVRVAIPDSQVEHIDEVDAVFSAAGYKRDPNAPEFGTQ